MKIIIALVSIFHMGCTSLPNLKEVDFSITGLEMEFYEDREKPIIYNYNADIERRYHERKSQEKVANRGKLMPMTKK